MHALPEYFVIKTVSEYVNTIIRDSETVFYFKTPYIDKTSKILRQVNISIVLRQVNISI